MDWVTQLVLAELKGPDIVAAGPSCKVCLKTEDLMLCAGKNLEARSIAEIQVYCRDDHVKMHQQWGTIPEEDVTDNGVFDASLAQNGQVTLKKSVRDALGIIPSDIIILRVIRVISPNGYVKWDSEKEV